MKNLYAAFETDKNAEIKGVKLDFGGPSFTVRRAGGANRKYSAVFQDKIRPHRRAMDAGTMDEAVSKRLLMEVYFETVVIGWDNVTNRAGEPLEFNQHNFITVMTDLPDLWDILRVEAAELKNFQTATAAVDGEALGN